MKDVNRMTIEILKGYEFGDPRSYVPVNYDNLKSWRRLEEQVAEIQAKGGVVHLPGYMCPYTEYDTKTKAYTRTPPPGSPAAIEAERGRAKPNLASGDSKERRPGAERGDSSGDDGIELPSHKRASWESLDVGRYGFPINH